MSYPAIRREHLPAGEVTARRYRNRRIGEFLKEVDLIEGRSTGVPTIREAMRANGSPEPVFEFDDERTYFLVRLPIHPGFTEVCDLDASDTGVVERRVLLALRAGPNAAAELLAAFGLRRTVGNLQKALNRLHGSGLVEFTIPDKPRSKNQKRRLTRLGQRVADGLAAGPKAR